MIERLLPLGSVVYLKEGIIPVLILTRQPIVNLNDDICYMDYAGINQMTGSTDEVAYFNHEDISNVIFKGYIGENEERTLEALSEWKRQNKEVPKGSVSELKK